MKTPDSTVTTMTADEYRIYLAEHPQTNVLWEGLSSEPDEYARNVLMYQTFMKRLRVRLDQPAKMLVITPTRHQKACIRKFRRTQKPICQSAAPAVSDSQLRRSIRTWGPPCFPPISEQSRNAIRGSPGPIPARF